MFYEKPLAFVKAHPVPVALGGIAAFVVIYFLINNATSGGSSASSNSASGGSGTSEAIQAAQIQASAQIQSAQIQADVLKTQYDDQTKIQVASINAQLQAAHESTLAQVAASLIGADVALATNPQYVTTVNNSSKSGFFGLGGGKSSSTTTTPVDQSQTLANLQAIAGNIFGTTDQNQSMH